MQYGAGPYGPDAWKNFDISPTLRLQRLPLVGFIFRNFEPLFSPTIRYGDIVKGLPIAEGSCNGVYCAHVLEHLALDDFRVALKNTYRYMVPNGTFRFVLPDLECYVKDYVARCPDPQASMDFLRLTYLGHNSRRKGLLGLLRTWIGNSSHLWMWDYYSMSHELSAAGFTSIRRAYFGDEEDSMFHLVEEERMFEKGLGIECKKPALSSI